MNAPNLAVIIPHYNDTVRLTRLLKALVPQIGPEQELIVVDNASTEDLSQIRTAWPDLKIVTQPKRGAAEARNMGVGQTTAPALAFIDSDCLPASDWVKWAVCVANQQGEAVTGGRVDVFDETPSPRSGAEAFETVFAFDFETYITRKGFVGAGNMVTTREAFEKTGPFIHGLSEDVDWSHRAVAAGYTLHYEPRLVVSHPTRQDWVALERKWRRLTDESWGLLQTESGHGMTVRAYWIARALMILPLSIPAHIPKILKHSALTSQEKQAAVLTLFKIRLRRSGWMLRQAIAR